jgi:SAM-dependent methyltransferase
VFCWLSNRQLRVRITPAITGINRRLQVRVPLMPTDRQPRHILAELLKKALARKGWSPEVAAQEAVRQRLVDGMSARNIRKYLNAERSRINNDAISRFARLFRESEHEWLQHFADFDTDLLFLTSKDIIAREAQLEAGDHVTLISSRAFLEASDHDVAQAVRENLERGLIYSYYFPKKDGSPFGAAAAESYSNFRMQIMTKARLLRSPRIFGYSVDALRFRYFSALHTIVRFESPRPERCKTYAYIEVARAGRTEQLWYELPPSVWRDVDANLRQTRSEIADDEFEIYPRNPRLRTLAEDYKAWFKKEAAVQMYHQLRPLLGHAGETCVHEIRAELGRTRFASEQCRYLDVGCGDGEITYQIAGFLARGGRPAEIIGLDVSRPQLDAARKIFEGQGEMAFEPREGPFETFKSKRNFDVITSIHSMYVIDEAYIRGLFKLLAPGGIACIWMASRENNVITDICNAVDSVLRPDQARNTAEDLYEFAVDAGLSTRFLRYERSIGPLLYRGDLTADGATLVDFCALRPLRSTDRARAAALDALGRSFDRETEEHRLTDCLFVIHRPAEADPRKR